MEVEQRGDAGKCPASMFCTLVAVFELHGSQSMPGPLIYFHYLIGPMLLWKTDTEAPTLIFSVIQLLIS